MKFSAIAISPAVLVTLTMMLTGVFFHPERIPGPYVDLFDGLWILTWAAVALYWAARIVRYVYRQGSLRRENM